MSDRHARPSIAIDAAATALDQIDALLPLGGTPNGAALRDALSAINQLRWSGLPFGEKPGSLQGWLEMLFSARRHAKYPRGADDVRSFARSDISSMRALLRRYAEPN